jgi:diguanylate cyclase (GGDEF)-like protein
VQDLERKRAARVISAIAAVNDGIRHGHTLEEVAGGAARELSDTLECQDCAVFLVDAGNSYLMAKMGFGEEGLEAITRPEPLMQRFMIDRRPIITGELARSPEAFLVSPAHRLNSLLCIPVATGDTIGGFILIAAPQKDAFAPEVLRFVELMAGELSTAVRFFALQAKVRELTVRDELTGCLNRPKFDEDIEIEIPCAERYERPLSILLIAVDRFMEYRESSGRSRADALLRNIAEALSRSIRMCDKLYHYGDKKFALVMPGIDRERASFAAERILKVIARHEFEAETASLMDGKITISIGTASFPADAVYRVGLIKCLESALHRAKQSGGNTVV